MASHARARPGAGGRSTFWDATLRRVFASARRSQGEAWDAFGLQSVEPLLYFAERRRPFGVFGCLPLLFDLLFLGKAGA
jgi:hypothetical protein